ncbi:MAG: Plug domain-containing protein, partial [Candidatus Thiodiazotropha endolucinida]|nr:Plug domain-containing protein [Candidatus Thiodiazotropha taylori]MCW4239914.1 Plug domain-containing protein [Candidatus Thiodiazotropha taylori]
MFHKNIYTLSLLLLFGPQVHALHDEKLDHFLSLSLQELMDLEVTISTDTRQTVAKAPSAVTVITEEDIKATGATNLVDVLESVPGIHIRANQFGFRPLIQIRGATATQTLLMINGVS